MHYAISTKVLGQTQHVIYITQAIKLFEIFHFLWVFEFFQHTQKQKHKSKINKNKVNKQTPIKETC